MGNPFKKPKTPPPPPPPKPTPMPVADDTQVALDKKKKAASRVKRSGRVSTILSQDGNSGTLGGG